MEIFSRRPSVTIIQAIAMSVLVWLVIRPGSDSDDGLRASAGFPDQFVEYHRLIRTADGEERPAYRPDHLLREFDRAKLAAKRGAAALPWIERGPGNVGGRTRAIVVDPDDPNADTWYAAAVSGGIWKTVDEGLSWINVTPDLPNLAFSSLVQAASDPDILYAGSGEGFFNTDAVAGAGIFRSSDRGSTWVQLPSTSGDEDFRFVNRLIVSPSDASTVMAATRTGIFRSEDSGTSWIQVYATDTRVGALQIVADPSNFDRQYAAISGIGVIRSMDGGRTWVTASSGLELFVGLVAGSARMEIAIAPSDPSRLYVAIEDIALTSDHLYTSSNGGDLWIPVDVTSNSSGKDWMNGQGWYDNAIAVHPFDPNVVFLGGIHLWSATISGSTQKGILTGFEKAGTSSFLDLVDFNGSHFEGELSWGLSDNGAIVSQDEFVSVEIRFGPGRSQQAHRFIPPDGPGVEFIDYPFADYVEVPFEVWDVTNNRQLMVSFRDRLNDGHFDLDEFNALDLGREYILIHSLTYDEDAPDPLLARDGGVAYSLLYFLWPMLSEGAVWDPGSLPESSILITFERVNAPSRTMSRPGSGPFHIDQHIIIPIVRDSAPGEFELLVGNDGGVYFSRDGGENWKGRNNGYNTAQFYGVDRKPSESVYLGGTQDNGSWQSFDDPIASDVWRAVFGADGFDAVWNQNDDQKMIVTYQYNGVRKSVDGGNTWVSAMNGLSDQTPSGAQFLTQLERAQDDPDLLFTIGKSGVWKSTNFAASWSLRPIPPDDWGFLGSGRIRVSLSNTDIVWAGYEMDPERSDPADVLGRLHVSTDRGESFFAVPTPQDLSPGGISGLATHPLEDSTAFVLFSASGHAKVLKTADLGQTWEDLSGFAASSSSLSMNGFPNVAVYDLLVLPFQPNEIWVGTEIGLFVSVDAGKNWEYADNGLPAVSIWRIRLVDNEIVLATHGRGVWAVDVASVVATAEPQDEVIPDRIELAQNYPNPFNASTTISFTLPHLDDVRLSVFDLTGREIAVLLEGQSPPGTHDIVWEADDFASGTYVYRLSVGSISRTRLMTRIR